MVVPASLSAQYVVMTRYLPKRSCAIPRRVSMKSIADKRIRLTMLLLLLAFSVGTVYAQSEEKRDQPPQPSGQTGAMPGQGGMEGMRGGQDSRGQMT
jgi:hypothetical protein